jgi:hypothetical protein
VTAMNGWKRGLLLAALTVGFVSGLGLSGCLQTAALQCTGGTTECNVTCVYLNADPDNCGGCGNACQPHAICVGPPDGGLGVCECAAGVALPDGGQSIILCNGVCADVTTDPNNCGGCGTVCPSAQVCAPTDAGSGICQATCGTAVECSGSCVTLSTDPSNCGACGNVCPQGYSCHPSPTGPAQGTCLPDAVVACVANTGTVVPLFDSPLQPVAGPGVPGGTVPGGLGILGDGLLVGAEGALGEHALENLALVSPEAPLLGPGPDFVEVDTRFDAGSWVYVVDGNGNTLTVLSGPPAATAEVLLPDGGVQGLGLLLDGGYIFGPNTVPEPYARVGNEIFVPLYGGLPPTEDAGGAVVRLDLTNPSAPVLVGSYDLNALVLPTFDGGPAIPRPSQALFHGGYVYVVLNNLDVNYAAAGPSLLVKIDPTQPLDAGQGGIAQLVVLDSTVCLDAVAMAENSGRLLVSCFGQAQFDMNFNTVAVDRSAVLSLDVNDVLLSSYSPQCPDAGAACVPPIVAALAVVNGRVYVGDQSSGRVFVASISETGTLTQLVGYGPDGGVPLQPCPPGLSSVSDILRVP